MAKRKSRKRGKLSQASINVILVGGMGLGWWAGVPEQLLFFVGMALFVSIFIQIIRTYAQMGPFVWVVVVVVFVGLWSVALKIDPTATPGSIVQSTSAKTCVGIFCFNH